MMKHCKSNYHRNLINENSLRPKHFWKAIKEVFPTKTKGSNKTTIITDNVTNENKLSSAQVFSNYFSSIVSKLKEKAIPLVDFVWRNPKSIQVRTLNKFNFKFPNYL